MDFHNTDDSVTRRIRAMNDRLSMLKAASKIMGGTRILKNQLPSKDKS